MTNCPDIDPSLIAYADQRVASAAAFLDAITATEASNGLTEGSDDALAVSALSAALDRIITHRSALTDVLALAIRRLGNGNG
jgi:hypothetical protein